MPLRMKIALILATAVALTIAILWMRADMETWAETTVLTIDEPEERFVVVKPGDTLWQIARREYPDGHTGKMVYEILAVNPEIGRDCVIRPGQKVRLP